MGCLSGIGVNMMVRNQVNMMGEYAGVGEHDGDKPEIHR